MKRLIPFFFALSLLLAGCSQNKQTISAGKTSKDVKENTDLLLSCYQTLSEMKKERIYVALEEKTDEEGNAIKGSRRLVSYEKESGERSEITSPVLENALRRFDLAIILFQTADHGRECVIFSYTKENENEKVQNGFYYSPDSLPFAWWGRQGDLIQEGNRFLQLDKKGNGAYYTTPIIRSFYYFEKYGELLA